MMPDDFERWILSSELEETFEEYSERALRRPPEASYLMAEYKGRLYPLSGGFPVRMTSEAWRPEGASEAWRPEGASEAWRPGEVHG